MQSHITIPARFNGPPASGNGGYCCGLLAAHIAGPARIRLHVPPPLDTRLRIDREAGGGLGMYDGSTLVASGDSATLNLAFPAPPSPSEAVAAMDGFPWYAGHAFPTCFVCGPERERHDGLELFTGPVPGTGLWACLWRPAVDLLDGNGNVRTEVLWSALDCPGYFAVLGEALSPALLGELVVELRTVVPGLQPLIVYAWPVGVEGRKCYAGTAIATCAGAIVASGRATWIVRKG